MAKNITINQIIKIFVFLIILIIILSMLNSIYQKKLKNNSIHNYDDREIYNLIPNVDIIILGDSLSNDLIVKNLDGAIKFNSNGENFIQTYYKFKYFMSNKYSDNIKHIVISIGPHSLSSFNEYRFYNNHYNKRYINFFELSYTTKNFSNLFYEIDKLFLYRGKGFDIFFDKTNNILNNKNITISKSAQKLSKIHFKDKEIISKTQVEYLEKILQLAKNNDINVILIKYPISTYYVNESSKYFNIKDYYKDVDNILNKYDHITIFDYQRLYDNDMQFFKDSRHLNQNGSQNFTSLFKKDLKEYILEKNN